MSDMSLNTVPISSLSPREDTLSEVLTGSLNNQANGTNGLDAPFLDPVIRPAAPAMPAAPMAFLEHAMRRNEVYPGDCNVPQHAWVINVSFSMMQLPPLEDIWSTFFGVLHKYLRFCSIAHLAGTWEPVEVSSSYHLLQEPAASDATQMRTAIEHIIAQDLDETRPLWQVVVVPSSSLLDPSTVVLRVHHCIADGVCLIKILDELAVSPLEKGGADTAAGSSVLEQMFAAQRARRAQGSRLKRCCRTFVRIPNMISCFCANLTMGMRPLETESPFTKSAAERRSGLQYGTRRSIITIPAHSLAYVKALKNAANVSLNTIQCSVFTGALRRYCDARSDPNSDFAARAAAGSSMKCRASLPVPFLSKETYPAADSIRCSFAVISCPLALGSGTPLERLQQTDRVLARIKNSVMVPVASWQEEHLLKRMPVSRQQKEILEFSANHCLDFSNVPGPQQPVFIGGQTVQAINVALPNLQPQVIILSYNGQIHVTLTVDPDHVLQPEMLADAYIAELRALGDLLGVGVDLFCSSDAVTGGIFSDDGSHAQGSDEVGPEATEEELRSRRTASFQAALDEQGIWELARDIEPASPGLGPPSNDYDGPSEEDQRKMVSFCSR